jgi:bacillithiol system protein YtxJ
MKARITEVDSIEQLNELFKVSNENPVLIYKHSITCGISDNVYQDVKDVDTNVNVVIVQTAREISNEIEARTGIRHASPQAIVLKNGKPVYNASHYDITAEDLEEVLSLES